MKKTFRLYYWLALEFTKKNAKHILLSFFLSFVFIIILISLAPYLETYLLSKKVHIGLTGNIRATSLPEDITSKISNGLVFINEKGEIMPSLAESWKVNSSGTVYTFKLKPTLYWNDGKPLKAKDIDYSFKDIKTEYIDDQTIRFVLDKPLPIFPTYLRRPIIKYPFVGISGLYKVDSYRTEFGLVKTLTLSPNKRGLPTITYHIYDNEGQLVTAYKRGDINEMQITKQAIAEGFMKWKNSEVIQNVDYSRLMTLFFNMKNPIWSTAQEKEVRQAIRLLINPDSYSKLGVEANSSISPLSWAYNPDLKKYIYDKETAMRTLKKLNTSSKSAELKFRASYDYYEVADTLTQAFNEAGLKVALNFSSDEDNGKFDILLAYWKVPLDPDQYYFWHKEQIGRGNITGYDRPKVDLLLEKGRRTNSINERKQIYNDLQKVLYDDPPAVFLYYPYIYTVRRK